MSHLSSGARCLALAGLLLCAACRSVVPEAGLDPALYALHHERIVATERGAWFAIVSEESPKLPFLVVGEGDERVLYYATWVGERTARLMPVTRGGFAVLDHYRDTSTPMQWVSTPHEVALADIVGVLAPDGTVAWNRTPQDGTAVVLVKERLDEVDVTSWLVGASVVRDGKVEFKTEEPLLVLLDGNLPARAIRAASTVDVAEQQGVTIQRVTGSTDATTEYTARPAALSHGTDAFVGQGRNGWTVTLARPVLHGELPLAITSYPTAVSGPEDAAKVLHALRDVSTRRYLNAARTLLTSDDPVRRMRVAELLGAAGYVDWGRALLLDDADGLGADTALYLARAHLVSGDLARADLFVQRSLYDFASWPESVGEAGTAQALLAGAQVLAAHNQYERAHGAAIGASEYFAQAGDVMRTGDALLRAADFALAQNDLVAAVEAASEARSHYYHAGSPYFTAFAELSLADIYLLGGDVASARTLTTAARSRFAELNDSAGIARANLLDARILAKLAPQDSAQHLQGVLGEAQSIGDFVAVIDAAAVLVSLGEVTPELRNSFGLVLAVGIQRVEDPQVRRRAQSALAELCSEGLADHVDSLTQEPADRRAVLDACAGQ